MVDGSPYCGCYFVADLSTDTKNESAAVSKIFVKPTAKGWKAPAGRNIMPFRLRRLWRDLAMMI